MELKEQVKIIFFDVDFTAFDHVHFMVRPLTMYALRKLKQAGYKLCICTSRSFDEMKAIDRQFIEIMDAIITLAGGLTFIGNEVEANILDQQQLREIITCLQNNNIIYRYATSDGNGYLNQTNDYINDFFYQYYHMVPDVKAYENENIVQIMYYPINQEFIHEKLQSLVGDFVVKPMRLSNEIASKNVDKGQAIRRVLTKFGLTSNQAMAFGDSENDIEMFKEVGFSVCMDSGEEIAKEHANYVCEGQDEDGIYNTFVKNGFIEPYQFNKELFEAVTKGLYNYNKEEQAINHIAEMFVETIKNDGIIQMLALGKYGQFAQEFYYRSGGLAYFHKMEYQNESANDLLNKYVIEDSDMFVLISENANDEIFKQLIEIIKQRKQKLLVFYRHNKADSVIDLADYSFQLHDNNNKLNHTIDDCLGQLINYQTYKLLKQNGIKPLVFMSNNSPNSKQHNQNILAKYPKRVHL